jgi:hypothetical protein
MSDDRGKLTTFDWQEIFPWRNLATALRIAVQPRAMLLAAVALVGMVAGWRICGWACGELFLGSEESPSEAALPIDAPSYHPAQFQRSMDQREQHLKASIESLSAWPWELTSPLAIGRGQSAVATMPNSWWVENPLVKARNQLTRPFVGLFDPTASFEEFVFLLVCALWELVVWAFFGAAITRYAAVGLARDEQLSWGQVTAYARNKWAAYFTAPLFPLFGVLLAAIPLAVFGLLLRFELGIVVAGALWFLALLGGLFMAILLLGLFFGWPLMWATISVEGTDSFDALSRSYAYTYQRPLHYLFYTAVAAVLGVLGWIAVGLFAAATIGLAAWGASWFSGTDVTPIAIPDYRWSGLLVAGADAPSQAFDPQAVDSLGQTGLNLIGFWVNVVVTLTMGFALSFFWTSTTAIYFLLRRQVDATEMDEVFLPEERQPYGLPPLETDAAGVAGVADTSGTTPDETGPR